jgi:hypothetical protein
VAALLNSSACPISSSRAALRAAAGLKAFCQIQKPNQNLREQQNGKD